MRDTTAFIGVEEIGTGAEEIRGGMGEGIQATGDI